MSNALPTLDELGHLHKTDKASGQHNYLYAYDHALGAKRQTARTVVEIGVKLGASVRMWRDYFSGAHILGIDRNPACSEQAGGRISVHIGSQVDKKFLDEITAGHSIDIIIDDGSHKWAHQIESFLHLWPKLQPGGIYIIEDMHTSQAKHAAAYGQPPSENAALFFSRLGRLITANGYGPDETPDPVLTPLRGSVIQVIFGPKYCILTKRA